MSNSNPKIDRYGNKCWYNDNNELHRIDGPAVEYNDGDVQYWIYGEYCHTKQQYWNKIKELGLLMVDKPKKSSRFKRLEIK